MNLCTGDFLDIFKYFDKQGDGVISIEEFFETIFGNFDENVTIKNKNSQFLEEKMVDINEKNDKTDRENVFETITLMKKYSNLKTKPIFEYFQIFEEKKQETIDFSDFLNLLERMDFLITRGEAKKVFDSIAKNENNEDKNTIQWMNFYDCLTETVEKEEIKKEIIRHLKENNLSLRDFFQNYDINHDNSLNFEEFKKVFNEIIPELSFIDVYEIFIDIDKTKDNKISYEELEKFLISAQTLITLDEVDLESDIKFLMNFLRKSLQNKKMSIRNYFEDFIELEQKDISIVEFKDILKKINSTLNDKEIEIIVNYFASFNNNDENFIDFTLFYLFIECRVDFFTVFFYYHEFKRLTYNDFDYIFMIADTNNDSKLSLSEYNNFLKEIKIEDMKISHYVEVFYFLAETNQNYISKNKLRFFLENFDETQKIIDKKKERISFVQNYQNIQFQNLKNDKNAVKKYMFFKFSDVLPFLMDLNLFIKKEFKNKKEFEDKLREIFEEHLKENYFVSKIQFKLKLLKFHSFFNPMKLNKIIEILNSPKNGNNCDLEEFFYLVANFEEIFYSKLNIDQKIVN